MPFEEVDSVRGTLRLSTIPMAFHGARVAPFSLHDGKHKNDDA